MLTRPWAFDQPVDAEEQAERHRVDQCRPPAPSDQRRQSDDDDHDDADARAHERERAGTDGERVLADRPAVVDEDQSRQAEGHRPGEAHLEGPDDVFGPGPNSTNTAAAAVAIHGPTPGATHHHAQQDGGRQVQRQHDGLVRPIGPGAEQRPEAAEHQDGEGGPVALVRVEQVAERSGPTIGDEGPVVAGGTIGTSPA